MAHLTDPYLRDRPGAEFHRLASDSAPPHSPEPRWAGAGEGEVVVLEGVLAERAIEALNDEFSKRILAGTISEGKTVHRLSLEQSIPLSTSYRVANDLAAWGMLVVERIVMSAEGKKSTVYRSSFKEIEVSFDSQRMVVRAELNGDVVAERLRRLRLSHTSY